MIYINVVVVIVFASLGIGAFVLSAIMEARKNRDMARKGYTRQFVITCSADPGSWQ